MSHPLIDTHAHLCDDRFDADRDAVLARAHAAGVTAIVAVSETLADAQRTLALCDSYPLLKPACGLYPGYADLDQAEAMIAFMQQHQQRWVAIGEVGLDYMLAKEEPQRAVQRAVLSRFVQLSEAWDLPLNCHSRGAGKQVVELLLQEDAKRVQLHAYHGPHKAALQAVEAGWYLSIPPAVVRSGQLRELVVKLPLHALLLESDSPVLGPQADTRNEPANLTQSLAVVAELHGLAIPALRERLWENSLRLYGERLVPALV
ncbi:TatD-related deoxyribonuclease [Magnetococcus marinus MC-1]|uniref:TatD-related deoxyribonuclease n=1 Tax=Magnetococcus marinus (strain ATCC BAA-1437 / JCM 17883 / MC-1) TaxID=156889 RepID=A0LDU3_MAGMM|nr:TatD family hydrolase [Magnetococcus marinus]ABK46136.1 TatD-related deoxyribonuclease [Magnetococcus marinus MC-1]